MALILDIADAVAAELNAAPTSLFQPGLVAVRRVLPEFDLAELAEMKISVVPKSVTMTGAIRSAFQYDAAVDVGVQKKLETELDEQVADLCSLMDILGAYLCRRKLDAAPYAAWIRTSNDPIYMPEHLATQRVFTSVLNLSYRVIE